MKYVYSAVFILLLGFVIAAAEKHLNVEMAKTKNYEAPIQQQETTIYEYHSHGVPYEFTQDSHEYIADQAIHETFYGEATPVTSNHIKEHYIAQFESLQNQALQELSQLVQVVIEDYTDKKANGEPISYLSFYQTYYPQLKQLESYIDAEFAEKYTQLEEELVQYGYSPDKALKFKEQFETSKQDKLKELISLVSGN
ncbi:hypothetical protein AWH56_004985 [Anaerobacillus isosaccharinicus]|uniref:Uncharacterized protein n=1 Tax=Anaerobacillus isosaccharinicus TaxID=1532552 RepID=A0A1S2LB63_9BACI|nr:hypothetical protein [Anaerobacillus isosaccharinicus]MBA5584619.1 hypothetical protein [Anaerobacillus isosaccharinicus]QOY37004.1 hypothetical protein AWH56_004985 [Anaerobacillus isosaccharinicus]